MTVKAFYYVGTRDGSNVYPGAVIAETEEGLFRVALAPDGWERRSHWDGGKGALVLFSASTQAALARFLEIELEGV